MANPLPATEMEGCDSQLSRRHRRRFPMIYSAFSVLAGCAPVANSFVPRGSIPGAARNARGSERAPQLQGPLRARNFLNRGPWATENVVEEAAAPSEDEHRGIKTPLSNIFGTNGKEPEPVTNGANGSGVNGMGSPLGFLKRDVSPPVVDDEWVFSLEETASDVESESTDFVQVAGLGLVVAGLVAAATVAGSGVIEDFSLPSLPEAVASVQNFFSNPTATLEAVVQKVEEMGPSGLLYFGVVYTIAEILAIPAIPLTASAGYLFGVTEGTAVVLASASIAAAVSFIIGRTLLRSYVESVLEEYPKFRKIDKAIGREGFKLMLLLRLSPIFPFALSNYLYGATSVEFWPFFFGTILGFTPGTIAYVYTGEIGKALTLDSATASPWYVYLGGMALLTGFLKVVADVATGIIEDLDDDDDQ